jgi:hypothetical protein
MSGPFKTACDYSEPSCPSVPCSPHALTPAPSAERRFAGCFQRCLRMRPPVIGASGNLLWRLARLAGFLPAVMGE